MLVVGRGSGIARAVVLGRARRRCPRRRRRARRRDARRRLRRRDRHHHRDRRRHRRRLDRRPRRTARHASTTSCRPRRRAPAAGSPTSPATRSGRRLTPRSSGRSCWPSTSARGSTEGGSFVLFSGVAAFKIAVGTLAVGDHQRRRRHADPLARASSWPRSASTPISPGVIDTGAWDALGETGKAALFAEQSTAQPGRAHRHRRGRRLGGAVRPHQHLPHRRRRSPSTAARHSPELFEGARHSQPTPSLSASRRNESGPTTRTECPMSGQSRSGPFGTHGV